jgi:hypothetical protein
MKTLLLKANLNKDIQELNDVNILEKTIKDDPLSIYLIDSDKIINKNIITDKLNFLKPKDAIYKDILQEAGIDDMCFNSDDALVEYIKDKLKNEVIILEDEEISEDEINNKEEERDMAEITQIDEIFEEDLLSALDVDISDISSSDNENINQDIEEEILSIDDEDCTNIKNDTNELKINSSNIDDVTALIKELLNNKTLELSIKIKAS